MMKITQNIQTTHTQGLTSDSGVRTSQQENVEMFPSVVLLPCEGHNDQVKLLLSKMQFKDQYLALISSRYM